MVDAAKFFLSTGDSSRPGPRTNSIAMFLSRVANSLAALLVVAGLACLPSFTSAAYAAPGACSGYCFAHDPAVVKRADGTYFRFSTGGGIGIATASSLAGSWTYKGLALSGGSSISVSGNSGSDLWVCGHFMSARELWCPTVWLLCLLQIILEVLVCGSSGCCEAGSRTLLPPANEPEC